MHKSLQIHCVHFAIIQKSLLLFYQVSHFWEISIESGYSTNPNIFPGLRWVPNRDTDSDADTDAQMKMVREACRLLRASENLAGTADGKPGVFLEAERPQRDFSRLDLMIMIIDR